MHDDFNGDIDFFRNGWLEEQTKIGESLAEGKCTIVLSVENRTSLYNGCIRAL